MEKNTHLPVEVAEKILAEAKKEAVAFIQKAPKKKLSRVDLQNICQVCYGAGATAYATKLHQVEQENADLKRWKQEAIQLLAPIMEYGQGHKDAKLGGSCTEFTLQRAKLYDTLKAQPGPRWVKAADRLPGWAKFVEWRHESKVSAGKDTVLGIAKRGVEYFRTLEWLDEQPAEGREEDGVPLTDEEIKFLEECNLFPHANGSVKVLTENDEGAWIERDEIIRLASLLHRYAKTEK